MVKIWVLLGRAMVENFNRLKLILKFDFYYIQFYYYIQNFIKIRLETYIYKILLQLHQNSKIKKLYKHFHSKT